MTDAVVKQMIEGGFLEKIDLSKIPNVNVLNPDQYDDYKVASWTTQEAIVYNKAKFEELGIPAPTKYADLANPKLAGHVSLPDISSGGGVSALAGFNFEAGGNESDPQPGLDVMKNIDVVNYWKNGDDVLTQMKTGDVWAAAINVSYAKLGVEAGLPLAVTHVQIGDKKGMKKAGYLGIIKGTPVPDAAAFFINAYLSDENQYQIHVMSGELPVNRNALQRVMDYYKEKPEVGSLFLLSPEDSAKLNHPDVTKLDLADWSEKWNRMAAGH
jgi:putative spermidine/putrescine transport system substrate-binding protein